jgi:four helix bundle protein
MTENLIQKKSYEFALRIVKLSKYLNGEKKEFILSKQIIKSGTSIGANVEEGLGAQSKKDFIAKMQIALKETRETTYWVRLLRDSSILEADLADSFIKDSNELKKILSSIIKTSKERTNNS